jgi:calcineurin-like phosphoesterase family protein
MTAYFTSDSHFGHQRIIEYCDRPFKSVEEMNQSIIQRWNSKVGENDTLYFLGDWALGGGFKSAGEKARFYREKINCKNIYLIWGNHDHSREDNLFKSQFVNCQDMMEINVDGKHITLCHYALKVWNKSHHGSWHLYGHSHGTLPDDPNSLSFDCGVDCHNFYPLNVKEINAIMDKKEWKSVDHHKGDKKKGNNKIIRSDIL